MRNRPFNIVKPPPRCGKACVESILETALHASPFNFSNITNTGTTPVIVAGTTTGSGSLHHHSVSWFTLGDTREGRLKTCLHKPSPSTAEAPAATAVSHFREGKKCWVEVPGGFSACTGLAGCRKACPCVAGTTQGTSPEAQPVRWGCPRNTWEGRPHACVWPQTLTCADQTGGT